MRQLAEIGWDGFFQQAWDEQFADSGLTPARIASSLRGAFILWAAEGEIEAPARPKLFRRAGSKLCTGDWVALRTDPPVVEARLPRKTKVARKAPGLETVEQVLGANVDVLFLVQGLDRDFNVRRIERYMTIAWDSGAQPVIVLNKADICNDVDARVREATEAGKGAPVVSASALTGEGVDVLLSFLAPGKTAALIGSSGVGKSELTNRLAGGAIREVGAVREADGRGRHTTVGRELIQTPQGWLLMDLPGIREVQPSSEGGVEQTFPEVEALIAQCKFSDCSHQSEPGCAIQAGLRSGELQRSRYENYCKVQRDLEVLAQKKDARLAGEAKQKMRKIHHSNRGRSKGR
jgi:ribosome biogenesis GTPase